MKRPVAIVSGAGSGIGAATAELFAASGKTVVLVDRNAQAIEQVATRLRAGGATVDVAACDVARAEDVADAVGQTIARHGRIDILHNNAGITAIGNVETLTEERWDTVIDVDLKSIFLFSKVTIPHMRAGGGGSIVNTASVHGIRPAANRDAYSAAKGGVIALTKAMAVSFAKDQIRVNCVCPGTVDTAMVRGVASELFSDFASAEAMYVKRQPLGKLAQPVDVARAVVFLASDEAAFVTGSAFVVDGGMILV